ncbi:MAG TPA: ABC transporter ATP-binding protein [Actinomycetota bacterium]|nr:ABC transporter ATP-binding protein [Actinomycetota bacterium]
MRSFLRRLRAVLSLAFRANPGLAALALTLGIVSAIAGPISAAALGSLVDAAAAGDTSSASVAAIVLSLTWVASHAAGHAAAHVAFALNMHIIRLSYSELIGISGRSPTIELHERPEVADRVELVRKDIKMLAFAMLSFVWAVGIVTQLATTLVILVSIHLSLVVLPLLGIPSLVAGVRAQRLRQGAREATLEDQRLSDHLFGLGTTSGPGKEVRIFGLADEIADRHGSVRRSIQLKERRAEMRALGGTVLGWLAYAVGYAGAVVLVSILAVDGRASVGDVILVISLAGQIQFQLGGAVQLVGDFIRNLRTADHYLWLRDHADRAVARRRQSGPPPEVLAEGIRFEDVSFHYPGTDVDVLRDIDLAMPAGSAVAIVGVNGAGKTTLAKLLAGFYEPTEGRITVDRVDLRDLDLDAWRARMSACFQDFVHFEFLARESTGVGDLPRIDDERSVSEALARAKASDVVDGLPDGLGTLLGKGYDDGVELSTGQWQKVALGRAMMREDPLLLILDEPTASLDAYTEHALFERYAHASERAGREIGAITVLISHRFSTVRMADLVVVLEDGRIVQSGTHAELERDKGAYRELYELQSRAYR